MPITLISWRSHSQSQSNSQSQSQARRRDARALLAIVALIAGTVSAVPLTRARIDDVPYPDGYRRWTHVKTGLIASSHVSFAINGGFHHIYANAAAIEGYATGTFKDGAVLVFDRLAANETAGAYSEGARANVDVMVRDSLKYASTGGWGFERFAGDSPTTRVVGSRAVTACYSCHEKQRASGYVFSVFRK